MMQQSQETRWWEMPRREGKQGSIAAEKGASSEATISCPKCKIGLVVYNGNYFCDEWGIDCDWALPHPVRSKRDKEICDLIGINYQ